LGFTSKYHMSRNKVEHRLVKEFKKLSPEAKGEVLSYTKWMRDVESKGRMREFRKRNSKARFRT